MVMRISRSACLSGAVVLLASLLVLRSAYAHAAYERSAPGAGALVSTAPAQVDIWFTQDMFRRQGENWIRVSGPDGAEVQSGEAAIDDDDRRHMSVALAGDLEPGEYIVNWRTLSSEDGDSEEGTFSFTFDPQAQTTSTPMQSVTATSLPPTSTPVAPRPSPTVPSATGVGCAAGLVPAIGLVALTAGSRRRKA
jgi:methionine-rich copper-binding protein CopC